MTISQAAAPNDYDDGDINFQLSDAEFNKIRSVIKTLTGINMSEAKKQLVYRRLAGRLKATRTPSFADYLELLQDKDGEELEMFTNAVTTNLTSFFREKHHFEFLRNKFVPEMIQKRGRAGKRFRIWSAGCSTGEEPYSIAITLKESMGDLRTWDAKVLCTDIDSDVIATCKAGVYPANRIEKLPAETQKRWFQHGKSGNKPLIRAHPGLHDILTFKQLNLMNEWPMRGKFDLIFCRNVIIYFDKDTQRTLMARYAKILEPGGYLILGHSESLHNVSDDFTLLGQTIYRKND